MPAYYNEHDAKAAAWLRELIAAGLIAPGEVDERSIADVQAGDLLGFTQCHFFAGIGGWSYALRLAGWSDERPVWTGSCPCQPFSSAGKQLGDKDERHLWPVFFRLIAECRPEFTFGEQVASAIGKGWLDGISADLEREGYACGAAVLGAHSVGAPHIRQRLYWMAHAENSDRGSEQPTRGTRSRGSGPSRDSATCGMADAECDGGRSDEPQRGPEGRTPDGRLSGLAHTRCSGDECGRGPGESSGKGRSLESEGDQRERRRVAARNRRADGRLADAASVPGSEHGRESRSGSRWGPSEDHAADGGGIGGLAKSSGEGSQRLESGGPPRSRGQGGAIERSGEAGGMGNANCPRFEQHSERNGAEEQPGLETSRGANARGSDAWSRFDLLPCRDGKARRVESGTFPLAHGVSGRVGLLRGYGNAIVPQVAAEFIQACEEALA